MSAIMYLSLHYKYNTVIDIYYTILRLSHVHLVVMQMETLAKCVIASVASVSG